MQAKPQKHSPQADLIHGDLEFLIDLNHELCLLADKINWGRFEQEFAGYFPATVGNPALPARLVVGVLYLKHALALSDEAVVAMWKENPYWQYFCGMQYFQHELHKMSERISMRKIREILRLKWDLKRSNRQTASSIGISSNTVGMCVRKAIKANLSWPLPEDLDDEKLEALLYTQSDEPKAEIQKINWECVYKELKRKGVTLQLLWYEHKSQYPQSVSYSRYCILYNRWLSKLEVCLR